MDPASQRVNHYEASFLPNRPGRNRPRSPERSEGGALTRPGMRRAATTSIAAQAPLKRRAAAK